MLSEAGIDVETVRKVQEGRPNLLDYMANGEIQFIFNTPSGKGARTDEGTHPLGRRRLRRALRDDHSRLPGRGEGPAKPTPRTPRRPFRPYRTGPARRSGTHSRA